MMGDDHPDSQTPAGEQRSIWLDTSPETSFEALDDGLTVDTAIIGGGIAGITTAFELVRAGQSVAVIDRDRILTGVTGHTTAKVTSNHGFIYDWLVDTFGEPTAERYAEANEAAIDHIDSIVSTDDIDCDFERLPALTYVESADDRDRVRREVEAAKRLGLPATYVEDTGLPYEVAAAVRFEDQAQFHPRQYLLALADRVTRAGGHVFEQTRATDVAGGEPCRVETDRGPVTADDVVIATHFPIVDKALYFARLAPKRSYVLAARLRGSIPEAMYYQPDDPYFSVRPHPAGHEPMVLIGGQNHRTGHGDSTTERYRALERQARDGFAVDSIEYRWSTQDYVSIDGIPFVGRHAPRGEHVYVATGFGGWGMSNGTAAGLLLAALIQGREHPWHDLYRPNRFNLSASTDRLIDHNRHALSHLLEDKLRQPPSIDATEVQPGDATVVDADGEPIGLYRDRDSELHAVSAVCTHMGCLVEWNDGERSWDCPCHGSRFAADGTVIDTPAVADLESYDAEERRRLGIEDSAGSD